MSIKVKAAPATTAPTPAAVNPNLIVLSKEETEFLKRHTPLAETIARYNGMITNGLAAAFPPALPWRFAREHLMSHLATLMARDAAGVSRRAAVDADLSAVGSADETLTRLDDIVDGTYAAGEPGRSDFFPPAGPVRSESERLRAMISGAELHHLLLPEDLTLAVLHAMAERTAAEETARAEAEKSHQNKATAGSNLDITTRTLRRRLGKIIRGRCGKYSPKLTEYGMKVPKRPTGPRRRKPAEKSDQPAQNKALEGAIGKGKRGGKQKKGEGEEKVVEAPVTPGVDEAAVAGTTEALEKK